MPREPFIKIDSELGKKVGLIHQWFDNATIWDGRPKALYVTQLRPVEGKSKDAYKLFLQLADMIYTPVELTAPVPELRKIAEEFGYEAYVDVAGTPYMSNENSKLLKYFKTNVQQNKPNQD